LAKVIVIDSIETICPERPISSFPDGERRSLSTDASGTVIVHSSVNISFPPDMDELWLKAELYSQGKLPKSEHLSFSRALKEYAKVTPGVAFEEFGKRKTYPVIRGLVELQREVVRVVGLFANEV
jgi:hypothetical protein